MFLHNKFVKVLLVEVLQALFSSNFLPFVLYVYMVMHSCINFSYVATTLNQVNVTMVMHLFAW